MNLVLRSTIPAAIGVALAICGPTVGAAQSTPAEVNARRLAAFQNAITARVGQLAKRCRETPDQVMTLLTRDTALTALINGVQLPIAALVDAFDSATVQHDSTKTCVGIAQSVVYALRHPSKS